MNSLNKKAQLDREEQRIHDAFSQISVDTDSLKRRMQNMNANQKRVVKRRARLSVAIAAMFILVIISGTVYAASGGLDHFISRFNPAFGALAIPPEVPAYAEDQGIRIEVIGAQQISNVVLAYLTIQDITGENRLTQYIFPDLEIYMDGQVVSTGGMSSRRLHFDRSTNTAYFEIKVLGDIGIPRLDNLEIGIDHINGNQFSGQLQRIVEGEWRIQVNTSEADNQTLIWTDIPAGDLHLDYISLSSLGIQVTGTHQWVTDPDAENFVRGWGDFQVEIELENRRRNIRPSGSGGGVGPDDFDFFFFVDAPVDMDAVSAVIVNGVRIPVAE
ncbi:MAG: hypothetical protein FWD03_00665 [Defluviitaleaceae bacterium]|nr:hypothetical protein [Defluviitaleaceae bacterium]